MRNARVPPPDIPPSVLPMPAWVRARQGDTPEDAAFRAGAALAHLTPMLASDEVPQPLLRERLALMAAEVCAGVTGRREDARALRDAVHLARPGDDPGPGGLILRQWLRAVGRPISAGHPGAVLERPPPGMSAPMAQGSTPVDRAAAVIQTVLADAPHAETAALILAEAALSRAMGLSHLVPLLTPGLGARDLRLRDGALRLACQRAVVAGAGQAVQVATGLARGAARLRAVTPMLRAKTAGRAVDLFLSRDALAPGALVFMSDRAARRLCDRLVDLGALRELTGRDAFRLYGI